MMGDLCGLAGQKNNKKTVEKGKESTKSRPTFQARASLNMSLGFCTRIL